jgi:lipopolysaccharide biosynthesis glycosyltransferase
MIKDIKKNLLVTLSDNNFIDQAKQLFSSVYFNSGWDGDYMLLAEDIPEEELKWFREKGILIYKCDPIKKINLKSGHQPIILDKLYLFTTWFKQWERIVYTDSDVIVRYSLNGLTKVKGIAASDSTIKIGEQFFDDHELYQSIQRTFNLKYRKKSFNTGLFVFSTDIITERLFDELLLLYEKYQHAAKCNEESIMNLYFYDNWKLLSGAYNFLVSILIGRNESFNRINAIAYHFITIIGCEECRPWHKNNPFYLEWKENLRKSDQINLNNRPIGKEFGRLPLWYNDLLIRRNFNNKLKLKDIPRLIYERVHEILGDVGRLIQHRNEKVYYKLKKIKGDKKTKHNCNSC